MSERKIDSSESAEEVGRKIIEFLEQAEFGTTRYQAASDYLFLRQSEKSLQLQQQNATSKEDDPEGKSYWETKARITEQKIALLEMSIYQSQSRLAGYDGAYTHVGIQFEHSLPDAARKESEQKFPDARQQSAYVSSHIETCLGRAQEIIDRKKI